MSLALALITRSGSTVHSGRTSGSCTTACRRARPTRGAWPPGLQAAFLPVLLLVLARGLLRRRRVAYLAGLMVAVCAALSLGPGLPALLLIVVGVLLALRPADFPAIPTVARVRTALTA